MYFLPARGALKFRAMQGGRFILASLFFVRVDELTLDTFAWVPLHYGGNALLLSYRLEYERELLPLIGGGGARVVGFRVASFLAVVFFI